MNQVSTVAGITFVNKEEIFETLRPEGFVKLRHDPNNKYDKNAIEVWYELEDGAVRLGFLPKQNGGDKLQKEIIDMTSNGEPVFACIVRYAYHDGAGWNEEHRGRLQAIQLFVSDDKDMAIDASKELRQRKKDAEKVKDEVEVTSNSYVKGGVKFRRLTDLLGCLETGGKDSFDRLIKWAMKEGIEGLGNDLFGMDIDDICKSVYTQYKERLQALADEGTAMHNAIEEWLKGDKTQNVPEGFINFYEKYKPEVLGLEKTVFDESISVAGTYDAMFLIDIKGTKIKVAADWKSSKAVRDKHKIQVGTYGHWEDADEAWVIALGANTKQKFSLNRQNKEQCAEQYKKVKLLRDIVGG